MTGNDSQAAAGMLNLNLNFPPVVGMVQVIKFDQCKGEGVRIRKDKVGGCPLIMSVNFKAPLALGS